MTDDNVSTVTNRLVYDMNYLFYQTVDQEIFIPLLRCERNNDLMGVLTNLSALSSHIAFRMKPEEVKEVEGLLDKVQEALTKNFPRQVASTCAIMNANMAQKTLREVKKKLFAIMDRNGMLLKKSVYRDELKAIEKDLRLK